MSDETKKISYDLEARIYVAVGVGLLSFGIWVLGYQCFHWLQTAHWVQQNIGTLWDWSGKKWPTFEWGGIQVISNWVMKFPLSILAGVVGGGLVGSGVKRIENEKALRMHS